MNIDELRMTPEEVTGKELMAIQNHGRVDDNVRRVYKLGYKHGMEGRVMGGKERTKCEFDRNGLCRARACYSHQKCGARDKYGNPKYKEVKE